MVDKYLNTEEQHLACEWAIPCELYVTDLYCILYDLASHKVKVRSSLPNETDTYRIALKHALKA